MAAPPPSMTSESQPDGFRTASVRDPSAVRSIRSPSSSESLLASKAFLPLPTPHPTPTPVLGHILDSLSSPLLAPRPTGCWACTESRGWGTCNSGRGHAPPLGRRPCSPPHWAGTGMVATPAPKRRANKRKQTKKRRRAIRARGGGQRLPRAGQWGSPCECIRPGDWEWRRRPKEAMRAWRDSQEEGERAVMQLGTNLLLLYQILSQSIGVC